MDRVSRMDELVSSRSVTVPPREERATRTGNGMSAALWTIQALLAALFVFAGVAMFVMPLDEMVKQTSLPGWFLLFIGVAEIAGGVGLIVPALLRIVPFLTQVAACGLVIIMTGATVISLPMGALALLPLLAGILCGFVVYGRGRLRPIQPRAQGSFRAASLRR
jgi:uncharacterized membrane protein